jgi:enterochelin esterase-like enzyme
VTVYETRFYPESRNRWATYPGTRWVGEVVLPHLRRSYSVSRDKAKNAIVGLSTGGRGAVLIAQRYPELGRVVSLSGTYSLMSLEKGTGEYKIHESIFGDRERFSSRWQVDDCVNPAFKESLAAVTVYLSHGARDRVVPPDQATAMQRFLSSAQAHIDPEGGHDWVFWNAELARALASW